MLYKTGEKVLSIGNYDFAKHLDGTTNCTSDEKKIRLEKGETFPPHKFCEKACYWESA